MVERKKKKNMALFPEKQDNFFLFSFSLSDPEPKCCYGKLVMGLLILGQEAADVRGLVSEKNRWSYTYVHPHTSTC
jgi:hypothetical protein